MTPPEPAPRHTLFQDAQGILYGSFACAFAVLVLQDQHLITGQTAGVAVLLSYLSGISFGVMFFIVNLPFYWFGFRRVGIGFVLKTLIAVALTSVFTEVLPPLIRFDYIHPAIAAILAGVSAGSGLMAVFRHGASLGGIGIVALYVQDRTGFRAGWFQMGVDALVFTVAFLTLDPVKVGYSLIGAVIVNVILAINHRRDYYVAH